jgi:hypothetical protein
VGARLPLSAAASASAEAHPWTPDAERNAEGYARLGRERLDELLGGCERHHRPLHGR